MFYSSQPAELRAFIRDKLGFPFSDVGEGWLIFEYLRADMGATRPTPSKAHPRARTTFRFIATTSGLTVRSEVLRAESWSMDR
jgi:hypothetical protein